MNQQSMVPDARVGLLAKHTFHFECFDKDGNLKWEDKADNLIVNEGLDEIVNKFWKGSAYTAAFYVGILDDESGISAGDTAAQIATSASANGWDEITVYSEANRPTLTLGTVSSGSANNSASKAQFTFTGTDTVGGAFVITNNTKGGTTGVLIGAAAFSAPGDRAVVSTDVLNVTVTVTATSA